ncbi:MAG: Flp pilus assembly protein CpaB, partial [Planctomycetota bacterium]|nr:Flp pilus assembly protein CpaB [Planctomycetota bacterium]
RIAVVVLVLLGVAAAVCAVVLMRTLTPSAARPGTVSASEVEVFTVNQAAPAMTVVDGKMIQSKRVRKTELPQGALTTPVQFVGKVLTRPMVEGEPFTEACFATEGNGYYVAAALRNGQRAVSVHLRDHSAMAGLLYPGSVVDVIVSVQSPNGAREAIATTLLQGAQVLAIGSQTVTSGQDFKDKNPGALNSKGQQSNTRQVTLLVTPKQAEILQLAAQYGVMSLSMRHPTDTAPVRQELTRISEFTGNEQTRSGTNLVSALAAALMNAKLTAAAPTTKPAPAVAAAATEPPQEGNPLWEMLVVRGAKAQTQTFTMPEQAVAQETTGDRGHLGHIQPPLRTN